MTEKKRLELKRKLQGSRSRLLKILPGTASPLKDLYYVACPEVWHISVSRSVMYIDPVWFGKLGETACDFILLHELMHLQLRHVDRPKYFSGDRFHLACDIVANAGIQHLGWDFDFLKGIGKIYSRTFYPDLPGEDLTAEEALKGIPFDPSTMKEGTRRTYMIDSEYGWGRQDDPFSAGEMILSPQDPDPEEPAGGSTQGKQEREMRDFVLLHRTISGEDADEAEESPEDLPAEKTAGNWEHMAVGDLEQIRLEKRDSARNAPDVHEIRKWQRLSDASLDWRELLNFFVQEETGDYSFMPPDRRTQDSGLFLPDFSNQEERARKVLFMVDASGSISDDQLDQAYTEIREAVLQFGGSLQGSVGFFDVRVYSPVPFENIFDLDAMKPKGGGGTDYSCIFDYVQTMEDPDGIASLVIFTDGAADFPGEQAAGDLNVLWLFTDECAAAPWGRSAWVGKRQEK